MSYAALLSLSQITAEIMFLYPISQKEKQQIRFIYEPFVYMQKFVEDFPEKANIFDVRIKNVAHEAEDIIVSFISEKVSFKLKRQIKKVKGKTDSIIRQVQMSIEGNGAAIYDAPPLGGDSPAASLVSSFAPVGNSGDTVGLYDDFLAIKSRLCGESSNLQVIPIVGMGGIGKTTLAECIYNDPLTVQHFDIRAWVTLSQNYTLDVVLSCLLTSVEEFDKGRSGHRSELVGERVFKSLKGRRYLIVMDDIWSTEAWDDIRSILPDDGNGSRIMLTTRLTDVAAYPDPYCTLHELCLLDEDQSWNLLRQKVFANQVCPLKLKRTGEEIARNCRGLPLAIVVVAGLLSTVPKNPASWRKIARNVNSTIDILSVSYTHLPRHLRLCFLYMGIFPEDHEVRASKLFKLWAAEGFLRCQDVTKSLEDEAEECLEDLVKRNLVLVTKRKSDGKIKTCSLHDLIRDLCIRKAHEDNFFFNFRGWHVMKILSLAIRKNQPRLSVTPSSIPYLSKHCRSTTHTVLCFQRVLIKEQFFTCFRLLRVLDAGEAYVSSLPDQLFELVHLVYLAIYCLGNIPAAIAKLQNLQTFKVRTSNEWMFFRIHSVYLPQEIWRMPQLRHLVFYGMLPDPEIGITSTLNHLQTLTLVSHVMCTENIMRMIPNLRKLEIDCTDGRQGKVCLNSLVYLHQLENLKLRSCFRTSFCQSDIFTFPRTLKKLSLSRLPLPWDEMTIVGSLPNLRVLKLTHQACKGNTWETIEGEFLQLEYLLIEKSELEHWITESSHFPTLKCLVLDDCWQLTEIPQDIGEIPTLELIEVKGKARISLVESATRILEEQQGWGNDALQVRLLDSRLH